MSVQDQMRPVGEQLSDLFGSYKAEWLKEHMFELFAEPTYFPELMTSRPCMLLGGRGTGKTTVLRCMSYEGQFILRGRKPEDIPGWKFFGMYYRVNTNRVTAFSGPELSPDRWKRVFAHYFNLVCCDLVVHFLEWLYLQCPQVPMLEAGDFKQVAASLHLQEAMDLATLATRIADAQTRFEAYINNVADDAKMPLSMQGVPLDTLVGAMQKLPYLNGKTILFLLDEYENLEDYQQQVVNTLIKHSGQLYSFKIGVKELGWRCRTTLNPNEQLIHPSDYVRIRIAEKLEGERFLAFAKKVSNERIARLRLPEGAPLDVVQLLPELSEKQEAEMLDAQGAGLAQRAAHELDMLASHENRQILEGLTLLEKYFITYWASGHGQTIEEAWRDFLQNRKSWEERFHNYGHTALYTLKRGKSGIQKYYAGWDVLAHLSAGNIRYFLELVDQILLRHIQEGKTLAQPVSYESQTIAAQQVGKKNLSELEGLSVQGAQLTKLLLGLGRIFQTMAADPAGHIAEVTHFHVSDPPPGEPSETTGQVTSLLNSAVMHLALLRFAGSKLGDETETRDYDYMVHPIFSAFFVFSYRRKRKITLSGRQLIGLVSEPRKTVREILAASDRSVEEPLPDQLQLFQGFYGTGS
jgi:hypothetical protein